MAFLCHFEKMIEWWKKLGVEPIFEFRADGFDYYKIPVADNDERMKDPDYQAMVREMMGQYDQVLRLRFTPVLYVPEMKHKYALCKNKEGKYAVPISRSLYALQQVFLGPNNDKPVFRKLKRNNQVWNLIRQAAEEGVEHILYFVDSQGRQAENFLLPMVKEALDVEEFRGPNIRLVKPDGTPASGDEDLPEVSTEGDLHPDSSGGGEVGHPFGVLRGGPRRDGGS